MIHVATDAGTWAQALLTLGVLTYLYGENPIWNTVQHAFVGLAAAWSVAYAFHTYIKPTIVDDIGQKGQYSLIVPILLGLAAYLLFVPGAAWVARFPIAIWTGYGAGYVLAFNVQPWLGQITGTFYKLNTIQNWIIFLSVLGTLSYFFFTIRREQPAVSLGASIGKWAMMIAFGSAFGSTMLFRFNLLVTRLRLLLNDWLQLGT